MALHVVLLGSLLVGGRRPAPPPLDWSEAPVAVAFAQPRPQPVPPPSPAVAAPAEPPPSAPPPPGVPPPSLPPPSSIAPLPAQPPPDMGQSEPVMPVLAPRPSPARVPLRVPHRAGTPPVPGLAAARLPAPEAAPLPQAAAPVASAPAAVAATDAQGAWRAALVAWLQAHRSYPEEARRGGVQGRVVVRALLDRQGVVRDVRLVQGSGSADLDAAALDLLRGAHLPPPPADEADGIAITLPIRYGLTP